MKDCSRKRRGGITASAISAMKAAGGELSGWSIQTMA